MYWLVRLLVASALFASATAASASFLDAFHVRWAGAASQAAGVGAPDGVAFTQSDSIPTTFFTFGTPTTTYAGLGAALGVDPALLAKAEVIAWEANGGAPAAGGGWESSIWTFNDAGGGSATAQFSQALTSVFFANGTLTSAQYAALFGIAPAPVGVYSFLLIDVDPLPGVNAAQLTSVNLRGVASPGPGLEGSPDPDAVGLVRPVPVPAAGLLVALGLGMLGFFGRRRA